MMDASDRLHTAMGAAGIPVAECRAVAGLNPDRGYAFIRFEYAAGCGRFTDVCRAHGVSGLSVAMPQLIEASVSVALRNEQRKVA